MPTYVYECSSCNTTFEVEQRITESALDSCECGSKGTVKRVIQPIAVMFKGSGFHINDYSAARPEAKTGPKTEAKAETNAEANSEPTATPATPAPAAPATSEPAAS